MTGVKSLYDQDFVAWTEQQAAALRSAARSSTNQPLDWQNLAEEIESLGKSDRRTLSSQIYRIIRHLAKLQFSPAVDPRRGWHESIGDGRMEAELVLADSPSLTPQLGQMVATQTPKAIERAIFDLGAFGEVDRQTQQAMRSARYTADQILGDWFPPDASPRSATKDNRARRVRRT